MLIFLFQKEKYKQIKKTIKNLKKHQNYTTLLKYVMPSSIFQRYQGNLKHHICQIITLSTVHGTNHFTFEKDQKTLSLKLVHPASG